MREFNEYKVYSWARLLEFGVETVVGDSTGMAAVNNWFMSKLMKRELSEIKWGTELITCPLQNPMTSKFVPIHQHLKYKYLISMDGN